MFKKYILCLFIALLCLSACSRISVDKRGDDAKKIATKANMGEQIIKAKLFDLTTWQRVEDPYATVNVYIEGDGLAWLNKRKASNNPTPVDPIGLKLAALDRGSNVIYIARPCQYTGWNKDGYCSSVYWTTGRTAPEVIESFQSALDQIKEQYHSYKFNLIGYSGGASVAVLVAAGRNDVKSIRTVAGNTAYEIMSAYHQVSPMSDSIDPISVAYELRDTPQLHFVGGDDKVVPINVFNKWAAVSNNSACVKNFVIEDAEHNDGWVEQWGRLQVMQPSCD